MTDQTPIDAVAARAAQNAEWSPQFAVRMRLAGRLCAALEAAHEDDADVIVAAYIGDRLTGGPDMDAGITARAVANLRGDAAWWADMASQVELGAYLTAALESLAGRAIARTPRKRLMAAIWNSMGAEDRAAFAKWAGLK